MRFYDKIDVELFDPSKGQIKSEVSKDKKAITLRYPCQSNDCTPYNISVERGQYKFELYGASGGYISDEEFKGGHGAYTSGILNVASQFSFYAYLGKQGEINGQKTYNGGGKGSQKLSDSQTRAGSGGGATDIRLQSGKWDDLSSLKSRIMVSGGGAGSQFYLVLVPGGKSDINGSSGVYHDRVSHHNGQTLINSIGGSQSQGGSGCQTDHPTYQNGENGGFGFGGGSGDGLYGSGGGGGYYGGGAGCAIDGRVASGSGGSSFVSGYEKCNAISKDYSIGNPIHTGSSVHYSNIQFINPIIKFEEYYYGDGFIILTMMDYQNCSCQFQYFSYFKYLLYYMVFPYISISE